jgi:hypothetical protein
MLVLNVTANGVTGPDLPVYVTGSMAHLVNSCDSIFGPQNLNTCHPAVTHADGTLVSNSSPARVGETIVVYLVGLGFCGFGGAALTGYAVTVPVQYPTSCGTVLFTYPLTAYAAQTTAPPPTTATPASLQTTVPPDWIGLIPGYVGLYQLNVTVPPMPAQVYPCSTYGNASLAILGSGNLYICVQP